MKALVTGGAGFIGSSIVSHLIKSGDDVTVLDDLSTGHRANLDPFPDIRLLLGNINDPNTLSQAVSNVDMIFHLAASVGNKRSIEHPIYDTMVNVVGTLRILEAARKAGVRKVVYSSSAGIFGEPKTDLIHEDHPTEPDSPYGASKLAGEKMCLAYSKLYDLETVCLRYFNVYGPNQRYDAYGNVIPIFTNRLLNGLPIIIFGDGEQTRDFVHVSDVAHANVLAAKTENFSGSLNIASGTSVTINQLASLIHNVSGTDTGIEHVPRRPGDVIHSRADISAAKKDIGYEPTVNIEDGLVEYVTWAKEEELRP